MRKFRILMLIAIGMMMFSVLFFGTLEKNERNNIKQERVMDDGTLQLILATQFVLTLAAVKVCIGEDNEYESE